MHHLILRPDKMAHTQTTTVATNLFSQTYKCSRPSTGTNGHIHQTTGP